MAARTLDQILAALDPGYAGSRALVNEKMAALPGQAEAEVAGLDAKLQGANASILAGARRRGMGFSGIPVAEQAQYAASEYAPAVARTREGVRTQSMSLQEALLGLDREKRGQAEGVYNNELQRDLQERQLQEQVRQFNENLAFQKAQQAAQERAAARASSGGGGYSMGGGGVSGGGESAGGGGGGGKAPAYGFKNGKNGSAGFFFTDASGKQISAAKYASLTGANVVQLVQKMASAGDSYAKKAISSARGPGFTPAQKKQFNSLFW